MEGNRELRAQFFAGRRTLVAARLRIAALLTGGLVVAVMISDALFHSSDVSEMFSMRLYLLAICALIVLLPKGTSGRASRVPVVAFFIVAVVLELFSVISATGAEHSHVIGWLGLFVVSLALLFPLRVWQMVLASVFVTGGLLLVWSQFPSVDWSVAAYRLVQLMGACLVATVASFLTEQLSWREYRVQDALAREKDKSDRLLLNILPPSVAARLKGNERTIADGFDEVTVLFADLVGFTALSAELPPGEVVRRLNRLFSAFDDRVEALGLEKIKTIGDAYMVAGGLPEPRTDHAEAVATLALQMLDTVAALGDSEGEALQVRIGIHTGPVVGGVIGKTKFIYDLWGDTVNTASRMENASAPGAILVTTEVQARVGHAFELSHRGELEIRGKGRVDTWWLRGSKASAPAP